MFLSMKSIFDSTLSFGTVFFDGTSKGLDANTCCQSHTPCVKRRCYRRLRAQRALDNDVPTCDQVLRVLEDAGQALLEGFTERAGVAKENAIPWKQFSNRGNSTVEGWYSGPLDKPSGQPSGCGLYLEQSSSNPNWFSLSRAYFSVCDKRQWSDFDGPGIRFGSSTSGCHLRFGLFNSRKFYGRSLAYRRGLGQLEVSVWRGERRSTVTVRRSNVPSKSVWKGPDAPSEERQQESCSSGHSKAYQVLLASSTILAAATPSLHSSPVTHATVPKAEDGLIAKNSPRWRQPDETSFVGQITQPGPAEGYYGEAPSRSRYKGAIMGSKYRMEIDNTRTGNRLRNGVFRYLEILFLKGPNSAEKYVSSLSRYFGVDLSSCPWDSGRGMVLVRPKRELESLWTSC
eukprot:GHVN01096435.1.p1 GENE.GHVN01096435.1~~GHVN01096435.1.p1  ORF type:complete len:400 (-),score=17.14 GHVN01096435.1:1172-2371(-)